MAYGSAVVTAAELANKAADLLLMAATQIVLDTSESRWAAGNAGTITSADVTDSSVPISAVADRFGHKRTKPNATGTAHTLVLSFAPATVDGILIWGTNIGDSGDRDLQIDIADDGEYSTNLETIFSDVSLSGDRFMLLNLFHTGSTPLRYTTLEHMRLILESSTTFIPEIAEVWGFRRRQFGETFLRGFNPNLTNADVSRRRSRSGVVSSNTRNSGQTVWDGQLSLEEPDIATLLSLWTEADYGGNDIIGVLEPDSAPEEAKVFIPSPNLQLPTEGEDLRRWSFSGEEQIPYVETEAP